MKKIAILLAVFATLSNNVAHAQPASGKAAASAKTSAANDFNWGLAVAGVVALGVVVGVTAATAASTPSTFSH